MFEYVITAGEGTLIDHGVMPDDLDQIMLPCMALGVSFALGVEFNKIEAIAAPCDEDCETGK